MIDIENIPQIFPPMHWHEFSQIRTITLNGILKQTSSSDPPGAKFLYQRMEELDAVCGYMTGNTWNAQPNPATTADIKCLSINPFPGGGNYEKLAFVVPMDLRFDLDAGNVFIRYTLELEETQLVGFV